MAILTPYFCYFPEKWQFQTLIFAIRERRIEAANLSYVTFR